MNISNNVKQLFRKVFNKGTINNESSKTADIKPDQSAETGKQSIESLKSKVVCQVATSNQAFNEQFNHILRYSY